MPDTSNLVIATNPDASPEEFEDLMRRSTELLNSISNEDARYIGAKPDVVEDLVVECMRNCAEGTNFKDTIELVSGHKFPDIVAHQFYGTEVKSTKQNKWESFGNSIFENTRIPDIQRIYLTFGKMTNPVEFCTKPYEQCISGIVVDHSPRYHIDMRLQETGENTIFEQMGTTYDAFRELPEGMQVNMIAEQNRRKLEEGETLWWHPAVEDYMTAPSIRLFSSYDVAEKEKIVAEAMCFFPEVFSNSKKKYGRYVLWLITDKNIATGNARDGFSASGQVEMPLHTGSIVRVPAVIGRLRDHRDIVVRTINTTPAEILKERWEVDTIEENRIQQWIEMVSPLIASTGALSPRTVIDVLATIFHSYTT